MSEIEYKGIEPILTEMPVEEIYHEWDKEKISQLINEFLEMGMERCETVGETMTFACAMSHSYKNFIFAAYKTICPNIEERIEKITNILVEEKELIDLLIKDLPKLMRDSQE